jgi:hypothetical protein
LKTEIDHLVVAATALADGVRWCEQGLGVTPAGGGQHPLMGTHNRLVNLSSPAFPRCYLELIAVDPAAAPPGRARWFGLDALDLSGGPRLIHAVLRSDALDAQRDGLLRLGVDAGRPLAAHRDTPAGRLQWRILVRDDGALPAAGQLPTLIEWQGPHPADQLPDQGLTLRSLALPAWPDAVRRLLAPPAAVTTAGPSLAATLQGPLGTRTITA